MAKSSTWSPSSWREKQILHQPTYPDEAHLAAVLNHLRSLTPLVTSWEIINLKELLAEAVEGKRFLLQGGDCAESFDDCTSEIITRRLKVLLQMSLVLIYGMKTPVVRVGRFAGQYAKPRSSEIETRAGTSLPSYFGDIINAPGFEETNRIPSPERLLTAHSRSAMTLNFVRALVDGGFTDLHHPEYWDLEFLDQSPRAQEYRRIVESITEAVSFMESFSAAPEKQLGRATFYTSHEALLLPYEESQTRDVPHNKGWFNLSTHMPWIGMRTAFPGSAHVEYARGIENPIGMKVGPGMDVDRLLKLTDILNPDNIPGRLTLIHRFGKSQVAEGLPPLIKAIQRHDKKVLWCSDPMHGNTKKAENGVKTRPFEDILEELEIAFDVHLQAGSRLGGVHFELTGENVTECTGGARNLQSDDLLHAYHTNVDPRLNAEQALEMALCIVRKREPNKNPTS